MASACGAVRTGQSALPAIVELAALLPGRKNVVVCGPDFTGVSALVSPIEKVKRINDDLRPVDVPVARPVGESYLGRDSQLDAAVNELLKQIGNRR